MNFKNFIKNNILMRNLNVIIKNHVKLKHLHYGITIKFCLWSTKKAVYFLFQIKKASWIKNISFDSDDFWEKLWNYLSN